VSLVLPHKVLFLCFSKSWGGLEMYPARVAPALARQGWEVHAATLRGSRVARSLLDLDLKPIEFQSVHTALLHIFTILRYLKAHGIRVVHANKSADMRIGALLVALDPSIKLFFTDHMGVTKPKKDWFHRWTYSKVNRLFSVSDATLARNRRAFPVSADRISRLYLGIDLGPYATELSEQERATQRLSMNVPVSSNLIAIPGRINDGKGHMEWVQALGVLRHTRPDLQWHAVVIGQASGADALAGGFQDRLMAQVQALGLESVITFTGFREDMPDCLKALDIVAIPSYNEAFGLSVVEAMAAGCAVVGADSGAIPEMITPERGRLAAPKDSQAWAQAFAELLDDTEQRQRIAKNAKAWSHAHFSMDQHVRSLSAFYLEAF